MTFITFFRLIACSTGGLLCLLATPAAAWNAAGHRIGAALAWQEMTPPVRQQVAGLLAQHPAHARWIDALKRGAGGTVPDPAAIFAEASTWPDELRREGERDPAVTHRDWHYVNWPANGPASPDASRGGRLDQEIGRQAVLLGQDQLAPAKRAEALAWLLHLVGDAHQPLHVVSWPLPDGDFDDGGLAFLVHDPQRRRVALLSLHAWWDDLPGPPWLRGERLRQRVQELRDAYPAAPIVQGGPADWLAESFTFACQSARPAADRAIWQVTDRYRALATDFGQRQLFASGVRLGRLLNDLLGDEANAVVRRKGPGA